LSSTTRSNITRMADLLNLGNFTSTGELVQQLALLNHLRKNDADSRKTYERVTGFRVITDVWSRLSGQDKIDAAQAKTILAISEYVKKNPKASKAEVTQFVAKEIQQFAALVDSM